MAQAGNASVLVVEDESSIASFVALYLKNAGYAVRTVANGSDALSQVASDSPSLIVLDLLWELLDHRGLVLTRDQLLERVWGYTFAGDTRTVDVHVRQLRRKLGDASPIVTVWGVGYKVSPAREKTPG